MACQKQKVVNSKLKMVDKTSEVNVSKKSKKKQKSLFVPNREAYDRINFLYQVNSSNNLIFVYFSGQGKVIHR